MFSFITNPVNYILDVVEFIICLIGYVVNVFKWTGLAVTAIIKLSIAMPFCFFFYILHVFIEFILFIVFDILLIMILWPSKALGEALGYPIRIPINNREIRKFKSNFTAQKLYNYAMPKVILTCYSFNGLEPFPKWNLKIPKYK